MDARRQKITPAPDHVPPAPYRGQTFQLADNRFYVIPPPTLAQIHGPCAVAFAAIANVIASEQWGVAVAVENLAYHATVLVHEAMSRNYDIERACPKAPLPWYRRVAPKLTDRLIGPVPPPPACMTCVSCLLDMDAMLPVLKHIVEVSGYQELLRLVGHRPATASLDLAGTKVTTSVQ